MVGAMILGTNVALLCSAANVFGNTNLGVCMRNVCTFGVSNDETRGSDLRSRQIRRADNETTGVSLEYQG